MTKYGRCIDGADTAVASGTFDALKSDGDRLAMHLLA